MVTVDGDTLMGHYTTPVSRVSITMSPERSVSYQLLQTVMLDFLKISFKHFKTNLLEVLLNIAILCYLLKIIFARYFTPTQIICEYLLNIYYTVNLYKIIYCIAIVYAIFICI